MTIQRQYSLPNCTLVLEGLSDPSAVAPTDIRPIMSLLLNAECHLPGQEKPLTGGREFFESLVTAVSLYAQEFLSGVHLPRHTYSDRPSFVKLERVDRNHHQLSVEPDPNNPATANRAIQLTTVQLFDLVEAIDQFVADTQTLPFWSLNLAPVPRRFKRGEPLNKQVVPAAVGVGGLAAAAIALFTVPFPKVTTPVCLIAGAENCPKSTAVNSPSPTVSPSASPSPPEVTASPESSPSTSPDLAKLEDTLNQAPAITDPKELEGLQQKISAVISDRWKPQTPPTENLEYRLGVAKNGDILGYKPENEAALKNVDQTPLQSLLYLNAPAGEAIAQLKVVFTPQGKVEVTPLGIPPVAASPASSPSASASPSPSPSASPIAGATPQTEITDKGQLEGLQPKVYDTIDQNWKGTPPFEKDLVYRVRVKPDGTILEYLPENQPARDYAQDIPLSKLGKQADPNAQTQEAAASFKVVFKPSGVLQVNPWYGTR
jgi:Domain of unknown function (DUF4335)